MSQLPGLPSIGDARSRLCELRDVCFTVDGGVEFFVDEALEAAAPAGLRAERVLRVYAGAHAFLTTRALWSPVFVRGPRPAARDFAPDDRVFVLDELSYAENYAHLLIDDIFPALGAADAFGYDARDVQLVGTGECVRSPNARLKLYDGGRADDACRANVARWVPALLSYPYAAPPFHRAWCARRLLVGAAPSFSLSSTSPGRAALARAAREAAHSRAGVPPAAPLAAHTILVLVKKPLAMGVLYPELCRDVRAWAARLAPAPAVVCVTPADMGVREQLEVMANATVYVAEAGSTGYGAALFGRAGAVFLSLMPLAAFDNTTARFAKEALTADSTTAHFAKEGQVFLFVADVQVLYIEVADVLAPGGGEGVLFFALERAGARLNLAPVERGAPR